MVAKYQRKWYTKKRFLIPIVLIGIYCVLFLLGSVFNFIDKGNSGFSLQQNQENNDSILKEAELIKNIDTTLVKLTRPVIISSIKDIHNHLELIDYSHTLLEQAKDINSNSIKEKATLLNKELTPYQKKTFPLMRKKYGKISADTMWEHDVYIDVSGNNQQIINMTSYIFSANKNIKNIEETTRSMLNSLRFKEVRFRSYKGEDEYTSYKIPSEDDID